tara:strand:- start:237 stop:509 length:273 start_codon:yes stop_codon:yes gene_type:complete
VNPRYINSPNFDAFIVGEQRRAVVRIMIQLGASNKDIAKKLRCSKQVAFKLKKRVERMEPMFPVGILHVGCLETRLQFLEICNELSMVEK